MLRHSLWGLKRKMVDFYSAFSLFTDNENIFNDQVHYNENINVFKVISLETINMITFRKIVLMSFFNCVKMFPDIISCTISCFNNVGKAHIHLGLMDDGAICHINNKYSIYTLSEIDIVNMYVANQVCNPDYETINIVCDLLCQGGNAPTNVKINYVSKPANKPKFNFFENKKIN